MKKKLRQSRWPIAKGRRRRPRSLTLRVPLFAVRLFLGFCLLVTLAHSRQAQQLNLSNPEEAVKASRKIHCSLKDGEPVVFWWRGHVYSRRPGEKDRKVFNVEGMNTRACATVTNPQGGYGYRMVSREVMFYLDPETNQILRTWKNPWTGKDVEVIHVANDPVNQRPTFAQGPAGPYQFNAIFKDGQVLVLTEVPLFYPNPLAGDYQSYVGGTYQAIEMFGSYLKESDLLDATKNAVDNVAISWTRVSQWLPWMEMGDRPGQLMFHAAGMRLKRYDDLPESIKQEINANYPIYQTPPPLDDARPNETSWTHFKKVLDARRNKAKN